MSMKSEVVKMLESKGYGVEELTNKYIDLYDSKHLFVGQFKSRAELEKWANDNFSQGKTS